MIYEIVAPSFPFAGEPPNQYWKYLLSVGITAKDLGNCCVRKAEVIGVDSLQTVKVDCGGIEYSDIPVWIHTDQGARASLMKGEDLVDGNYFKNAALMFPMRGGISTSKGTTKTPEVLVLCSIDPETNSVTVMGVIQILQAMFTTFAGGPFQTYRFLIKISFFNGVTGVEHALYDVVNSQFLYMPTYPADGVPVLPFYTAKELATDVEINRLLTLGFIVPGSLLVVSTVKYGLGDVCYHEDDTTSSGWVTTSYNQTYTGHYHEEGEVTSSCYGSAIGNYVTDYTIGHEYYSFSYIQSIPTLHSFDQDVTPELSPTAYPDGQIGRNVSPESSNPIYRVAILNGVRQQLCQYRRTIKKNGVLLFEIINQSSSTADINGEKDGTTVARSHTETYTETSDTGRSFTVSSVNTLAATMETSTGGQVWPDDVSSGEANTQSMLITEYYSVMSTKSTFLLNTDLYLECVNVRKEIRREFIPASEADIEYTDPDFIQSKHLIETDQDCLVTNIDALLAYAEGRVAELFTAAGRDYETNKENYGQYFRNTFSFKLVPYIVPYDTREALL